MSNRTLPVVAYREALPGKVLSASEMSEKLKQRGLEITVERLTELADAFYLPHYRIDGGPPMFAEIETRKWVATNLSQRINGQELPVEYRVIVSAQPQADYAGVPPSISQIADRLIVQREISNISGIYFLCRGNKVTYVGQAMRSGVRIAQHVADGRQFDRAYILPVPLSALDSVESAFINVLKPEENKNYPSHAEGRFEPILESVGMTGMGSDRVCRIDRQVPND